MKIVENSLHEHLLPVELVSIRKKTDIILLDNTNTQYTTGRITVGEHKGKLCMFPKHSGYDVVDSGTKIRIIPKGDVIAFVEAEDGESVELLSEIKNICSTDAEWVNAIGGR